MGSSIKSPHRSQMGKKYTRVKPALPFRVAVSPRCMIPRRCDTWRNPTFERPQAMAGIELASNDTECATLCPYFSRAALLGGGSESTSRYHQPQKRQLGARDGTS